MVIVMFIGAPCSGKSTLAKEISDKIRVPYISSGNIARSMASRNDEFAKMLNDGKMAPEHRMRNEIHNSIIGAMEYNHDAVILDGFPRFKEQYDWIKSMFPDASILCVNVDTTIHTLFERSRMRGRDDDKSFMIRMKYYLDNTLPMLLDIDCDAIRVAGDGGAINHRLAIESIVERIWVTRANNREI